MAFPQWLHFKPWWVPADMRRNELINGSYNHYFFWQYLRINHAALCTVGIATFTHSQQFDQMISIVNGSLLESASKSLERLSE